MKIALIGYGKMGHMIEQVALTRGHEIVCIIDKENVEDIHSDMFRSADVAIEFTTPAIAESNIREAWKEGMPVVSGTTGWHAFQSLESEGWSRKSEVWSLKSKVVSPKSWQDIPANTLFFWSSNFSLGVNLFFKLNKQLAALMQPYEQYKPAITEIHHIHKLDAPSGTAVTLAEGLQSLKSGVLSLESKVLSLESWKNVPIESIREGEVPGTHIVEWDSTVDKISITHEAKSREGFALGAVIAAEFLARKKAEGESGFFGMEDLI